MKRASVARVMCMVSLALPAAAAAPGDASACASSVYLARVRAPDPPQPPAPPVLVEAAKPVDIVPPFPAPKSGPVVPPFPAPKPRPRLRPVAPPVDKPLLVADAEEALSEGKHGKAAVIALAAFPALKQVAPGTLTLADRALRVLAVATVRRDGLLDVGGRSGKSAADRAANLAWSVGVLRKLSEGRPNNPAYQTDLGEALARVPALRDDAARLLGDLADRDLLTTAEGYAALARLRAERGVTPAALLERCALMTRTPAVCAAAGHAGHPQSLGTGRT